MNDKDDYVGRVIKPELMEDEEDSRATESYPVVKGGFFVSTADVIELIISLVAILIVILVFLVCKGDHDDHLKSAGEAERINQVR